MKPALARLIAESNATEVASLYEALEAFPLAKKGIRLKLDYPSGPAHHLLGFGTAEFTPIFVASRVAWLTAHIVEQLRFNSLIRPLSSYNDVDERRLYPTDMRTS
ncbi:MAG TPA: citrate/2-methylcitrate synthase [Galbitalea sp.]|jgi:citrate synthase|nr:citrate/2-methylcitrate synthase [Galbitalea sp.]